MLTLPIFILSELLLLNTKDLGDVELYVILEGKTPGLIAVLTWFSQFPLPE
tara:strand:- start:130 stop:282 length:153 start_codon:yes stop_codon:yes gene_type:complete